MHTVLRVGMAEHTLSPWPCCLSLLSLSLCRLSLSCPLPCASPSASAPCPALPPSALMLCSILPPACTTWGHGGRSFAPCVEPSGKVRHGFTAAIPMDNPYYCSCKANTSRRHCALKGNPRAGGRVGAAHLQWRQLQIQNGRRGAFPERRCYLTAAVGFHHRNCSCKAMTHLPRTRRRSRPPPREPDGAGKSRRRARAGWSQDPACPCYTRPPNTM